MEMLVIDGKRSLSGDVYISGSKNSSLPIMIASLLSHEESTIANIPNLADTRFLLTLLSSFGMEYYYDEKNVLHIDGSAVKNNFASYDLVRKMRASVLVLGPLLARMHSAVVSLPGGCAIGSRPVDIHLEGLRRLGAVIEVKEGYIHAHLPKGYFTGAEFEMTLPSVGATENLIMAAVLARGTTVLKKVAKEPEVVELCEVLNKAGARIKGVGEPVLEIEGVDSIKGLEHVIRPDRVEAGTFIALAAATRSPLTLRNIYLNDLESVMSRFHHAGVRFDPVHQNPEHLTDLKIIPPETLLATDIETAAHPGFPTDMQAQFMATMTVAKGESIIHERIFENRMMHVPELRRMGAQIELERGVARIRGTTSLSGAQVMATDLRASASLVIAALCADGVSELRRVYHLDRGYESLEKKLLSIGACVTRKIQPEA